MKKEELIKLKTKTKIELEKKAQELRDESAKFQIDIKIGKIKNTSIVKNIKKDIAKILTVINELELQKK